MTKEKTIVWVTASFETKEELQATLKKYSQPCEDNLACWDEFVFTTELLPEYDAILVFNTPWEKAQVNCFPEKIVAFMMEPGIPGIHPWMFKGLNQYYRVYSPVQQSENAVLSHGFPGWYFRQDYNWLKNLAAPVKTKTISCIASNLDQLRGHRRRLNFIRALQHRLPQMDSFGKGTNFLPDKMDGLLPYRYSVAIENHSSQYYFSEKINDCFLSYTVPIYYGCKSIHRYFPEQSFITIDIENIDAAIRKIEELLLHDDWQRRLEAVKEARELVLHKYQPLAGAAYAFRQIQASAEKKPVIIRPIRPGMPDKILTAINKLVNRSAG